MSFIFLKCDNSVCCLKWWKLGQTEMCKIYEPCQARLRDSFLVRACKIGLSDFPFYCSNIVSAFGRKTPDLKTH